MNRSITQHEPHVSEISASGNQRFVSSDTAGRTILLISRDDQFQKSLRSLANTVGLIMVKAERTIGVVAIMQATRPVAVLLDLDLPDESAWETADILLGKPACPAVILLTGRTAQFDMRTAIRTGSLVNKRESAGHLLKTIQEALGMPQAIQAERNSIQRVLIRWLRPSGRAESTTPAYRFWGINE